MSTLDRFESVFNAAAREVFAQQPIEIGRVLFVHDLAKALQDDFLYIAKGFLSVWRKGEQAGVGLFGGDKPFSVREVLNGVWSSPSRILW
ncbi:MAG: hypothetical protein Ct9H300mP7_3180 [Verrucomicrobiota bacterium]|nr:MAG: hypothetical protein Ct9H300mP7_3180 [Verrucomicrobiota bacterium]